MSALEIEDGGVIATAQILGGKVLAEMELPGERGIVAVLGGAFSLLGTQAAEVGAPAPVVDIAPPPGLDALRMSLRRVNEAEGGDVDIASADMLVSVGRGIESEDNLEIVRELADAPRRPALCVEAGHRRWMAAEDAPGRPVRREGQAQGLSGVGHLGSARAPRGHAECRADRGLQHRPASADIHSRPLRHDRRPV